MTVLHRLWIIFGPSSGGGSHSHRLQPHQWHREAGKRILLRPVGKKEGHEPGLPCCWSCIFSLSPGRRSAYIGNPGSSGGTLFWHLILRLCSIGGGLLRPGPFRCHIRTNLCSLRISRRTISPPFLISVDLNGGQFHPHLSSGAFSLLAAFHPAGGVARAALKGIKKVR